MPNLIEDSQPAPGDRDLQGRCWWGHGHTTDPYTGEPYDPCWTLAEEPWDGATHWLPAADLPVPHAVVVEIDDEETWETHPSLTAAQRNPSLCR